MRRLSLRDTWPEKVRDGVADGARDPAGKARHPTAQSSPLRDTGTGARVSGAPCLPPLGSTSPCLHTSKQAVLLGEPTQSVQSSWGGA